MVYFWDKNVCKIDLLFKTGINSVLFLDTIKSFQINVNSSELGSLNVTSLDNIKLGKNLVREEAGVIEENIVVKMALLRLLLVYVVWQ